MPKARFNGSLERIENKEKLASQPENKILCISNVFHNEEQGKHWSSFKIKDLTTLWVF